MITIFMVAFNEEIILPYSIKHYRTQFPDCRILIYNNESTDNTINIAAKNNCEVIEYNTNGIHDDAELTLLKNNCWKNATTDWVLVCDPDEFFQINEQDLKNEELLGSTIIQSEGWTMVNMADDDNFTNIKHALPAPQYDKFYLFNKKFIKEVNYGAGCHSSNPMGLVKKSDKKYQAYHYHYINTNYRIERYKLTATRLSEKNRRLGMGTYNLRTEDEIRADCEGDRARAIKIIH